MSDESKVKEQQIDETARPSGEWSMPEPVFRSSEGVSPLERDKAGNLLELPPDDEVPTETSDFVSNDEVQPGDPRAAAELLKQTVRVKEKSSRRHHKKKRSQSKLMTGLALAAGLLIGGVILAVIYYLFK